MVLTGGTSLMKSTGSPSRVTSFTGAIVMPSPCVKVSRSLMNERVGSAVVLSSRAERCTWRYLPSITYRSSCTELKS